MTLKRFPNIALSLLLRKLFFVVNIYEETYNLQRIICRYKVFRFYHELFQRGSQVEIICVIEVSEFGRICNGSVLPQRLRNTDLQGVPSDPITAR
jgi:hypothetical protein